MKRVVITTSWDDGHRLDLRLAKLLQKFDLPGTFYISPHDREFKRSELLKPSEIKRLSQTFEIGAHTMTHPRLTKVSDKVAEQEIVDSKKYLEKVTGSKVTSFCYPGGNYNRHHVAMVRQAGLTYARTVRRHFYTTKGSLLEANTTVNAYNHVQDLWKIARFATFKPSKIYRYLQWDNLAKAMFDHVMEHGGLYHLWGHSWEIDDHNDWQKLEDVFRYIAGRTNASYVTNGELANLQPKRLLITAPYFPPHLGGQESYAFHIAKQLQATHGWQLCVATTGQKGWRMVKTTYEGLSVYRLPYLLKISNTPWHPLWSRWLRHILKTEDIYFINTHAPVPIMADLTVRAAGPIPVVLTYHMQTMLKGTMPADLMIGAYERYALPRTLHEATAIICASKLTQDFLEQYRDKSAVITPAVDSAFFTAPSRRPPATLLFVGSLSKATSYKGLKYLLEAVAAVAKDSPEVRLLVAGSGDGEENYQELAERLGVGRRVTFLGARHGTDLRDTYQQATIFVLPTLKDNFPLVILEAMSSGLPVISTSVGSIPDMVASGQTGYLIKPGDTPAIAEKITYLLRHPASADKMGRQGRQQVETAATWQLQAAKTDKLLRGENIERG